MKKTGFGPAKPLPGQPNYKVSETQLLSKDAEEMESRLKILQQRLQQQQVEDESVQKSHGARWKSARADKGGIRGYGKETHEKIKKRHEAEGGGDPALRGGLSTIQKKSQQIDFRTKDVETWTISEVSQWLDCLSLSQYIQAFSSNEISGSILLDLSLDDLDYMGVTVLGHRKTLLREVAELRKGKNLCDLPPPAPRKEEETLPLHPPDSVRVMGEAVEKVQKEKEKEKERDASKLHWSQLEPLSSKEVSNPVGSRVNAADEEMDEEAEREAFRLAVAAWRGEGSGKIVIEREGQKSNSKKTPEPSPSSLWVNPFGPVSSDLTDSVDFGKREEEGRGKERNLSEGTLDEEAEREEFRKAVEAWRRGGVGSEVQPSSALSSATDSGPGSDSLASVGAGGRALAERLAASLEAEQRERADDLLRRKMEAQEKLRAASRQGTRNKVEPSRVSEDEEEEGKGRDSSEEDTLPAFHGTEYNDNKEIDPKSWEEDEDPLFQSYHSLEVSVLESRLGEVRGPQAEREEECYLVDYSSEED